VNEVNLSPLLGELRGLIAEARSLVAAAVNAGLTGLYWRVGNRLRAELAAPGRSAYGERVIEGVAAQLEREYGAGFSAKNLRHMIRFAEAFPDEEIVSALRRQLSWTNFKAIIYLGDQLQRDFYAEMCRLEGWSTRVLRERIDSRLFERTALSRKPEATIRAELASLRSGEPGPDALLKDPYLLDFLGLKDRYLEKDLEDARLRELESFLLELGAGFSFVARQKRIQMDDEDIYIDLLFFNRKLRRLVAIDLKLGDFKAEYKGQMELYLRWLAKHERQEGEREPLGIILCGGKKKEQIELLELDGAGLHVAEYLTVLPPREVLERKLHDAIAQSRLLLERREEDR